MSDMTEELIETSEPAQEVVAAEAPTADKPAPKKRGRKPKSATPPPVPVEAPKPVKKRRPVAVKLSKADKMLASMLESAEIDRIKTVDEMAKLMEHSGVKQARLDAIKWKVSALKGENPQQQLQPSAPYPNYPMPPQFPQPPAYPSAGTQYMPPGMRTPALPQVPMAQGGAVDAGLEPEGDDPDKYLKVGGVVGGGGFV